MKKLLYVLLCRWMPLVSMLMLFSAESILAQVSFKKPQPGEVYREYSRIMDRGTNDWRVTDPNSGFNSNPPGNNPADFLPNPTLDLGSIDKTDAIRAEAVISLWGGHIGTQGKKIRFNGNSWIPIPELSSSNGIPSGHDGQCYENETNVGVDVPLSDLSTGNNTFQGESGSQTCYGFDWGQHGMYAIVLRVYYNPSAKSHPTGSITSPSNGGTMSGNPTITVTASGGAGPNRVDVLAYYDGYDTDGDGIFQEYHHDYHVNSSESSANIKNHVGTATGSSPYQVTWNTQFVPDQAGNIIKLLARIRDANGIWFVTNEVQNLNLSRSGSVRLYKPMDIQEAFWVRDHQKTLSSTVDITDNLSGATSAALVLRTWNGANGEGDPPGHYTKVNSTTTSTYGEDHYYSFDIVSIPTSALHGGSNTIEFFSESIHHGVEICWPGPGILVSFGTLLPIKLASFSAAILANKQVKLNWSTLTETNNYGFEVQKSLNGPNNYQTIPNSFVAGHGTTITPQQYSYTDTDMSGGTVYYRLKQIDTDGTASYTEGIQAGGATGVKPEVLPTEFSLGQNYPNPFNPSSIIRYGLPVDGFVSLKVFNVVGQVVKTLVEERMPAGYHEVKLDAGDLANGMYLYRIQAGTFTETRKMILLK